MLFIFLEMEYFFYDSQFTFHCKYICRSVPWTLLFTVTVTSTSIFTYRYRDLHFELFTVIVTSTCMFTFRYIDLHLEPFTVIIMSACTFTCRYIYVAPCLGREIRVFRRNKDNSLTLRQVTMASITVTFTNILLKT